MVFPPPPVRGVGRAGGFTLMIEDRGDVGPDRSCRRQTENLVADRESNARPDGAVLRAFRANVPQLHVEPDMRACMDKACRLRDFADTLQVLPGLAVRQRLQPLRPHLAGDRAGRASNSATSSKTFPQLQVRNADGTMVPLGSLAEHPRGQRPAGADALQHVSGRVDQRQRPPGVSSGEAIDIDGAAWPTPSCRKSMAFEWTDMSYLELLAGNTAMIIFGFAVVMVFLVLAAQYESWSLPLAVILVVPMCLLSAIIGVQHRADGHQHLHADRLRGAGRPGEQERDPDRRVRQAAARSRRIAAAGDAGGLPAAAAADRDDVARLHPGRGAADAVATAPAPRCAARWARPSSAACSA